MLTQTESHIVYKKPTIKVIFILIVFLSLSFACSNDKQSNDSLACIDVRKNYPEKELVLTDIADVTYLHLNTSNDDYLYKGGIVYITKNTFVVLDNSSGSILFFSKEGNPRSRFNRYGQGAEEYTNTRFQCLYDEATDDVFVTPYASNYIQVYSSTGEYRRKLTFPKGVEKKDIYIFDEQSLLVFGSSNSFRYLLSYDEPHNASQYKDSSFFLISKTDGKVLEYVDMPANTMGINDIGPTGNRNTHSFKHVTNSANGFILTNPETDTVFFYSKDKTLTPVMHKKPLIGDLNPKHVLNAYKDTDRYQFLKIMIMQRDLVNNRFPVKFYTRDKETGEIFIQKNTLPDYKGKIFIFDTMYADIGNHENECIFELDLIELKQAYRENRLGGKLKELVATLNENEDNDVNMFVKFK